MGKKRKSGGDGAEESVPAKRATAKGGAQPNQRSDQAAAPPRGRVIKAVTTKSSSSSGQGARGKPEDGKAPKAKGASIDDMFGQLKSAKKAAEPAMPPETVLNDNAAQNGSQRAAKPPKMKGSKEDIFGVGIKSGRRYDEEGLPIFSPDELGIGKGGDTAACPFDCECCL